MTTSLDFQTRGDARPQSAMPDDTAVQIAATVASDARHLLVHGDPAKLEARVRTAAGPSDLVRVWDFSPRAAAPFQGMRNLAEELLPTLSREMPETVARRATELAALDLPVPDGAQPLDLSAIALPASERRLSRESEYCFRIANGLAQIVTAAMDRTAGFAGRALWLVVPDISTLDRVSLLSLKQLLCFSADGIRIVAGAPAGLDEWLTDLPEAPDSATDERTVRLRFLRAYLDKTAPARVGAPAGPAQAGPTPLRPHPDDLSEHAIFDAIQAGQYDLAVAALAHPDLVLDAGARARLSGLVHAYIGNFDLARQIYLAEMEREGDALSQARACMFAALLSSKRLAHYDETMALLDRGFAAVEGREDEAARLERGWLLNVRAFVLFRTQRADEAFRVSREALDSIKAIKGSDGLHLRINLISNMSILFEVIGDDRKSLAVWEKFEAFTQGPAKDLFSKIYCFRKAGLLCALGDTDAAASHLLASWNDARRINDDFHAIHIARALADVECRRERPAAAAIWLLRAAAAAETCGDQEAAAKARARQAEVLAAADGSGRAVSAEGRIETKLGRPFAQYHVEEVRP